MKTSHCNVKLHLWSFFKAIFKASWLFQLSPWISRTNSERWWTCRLHILKRSILIVSYVLFRPYSWSLAMDTSTHSVFSLLSSLSMFLNVIMMTSNVVSAEESRPAAAFVFQAPQWDRQACTPTRRHLTDTQAFILSLTLSSLSLFLLSLLRSQHTTGRISIVMCHVASHWLESITAGHPVSIAEDIYTSLLFVNHVQQEFIFRPLQSPF